MKVLKIILLVLVILVAILLVVAAFLPSDFKVARSIEINQPVQVVFNTLDNYKKQPAWDPWLPMDPEAEVVFSGPDSGVGATYSWKGKIIGSGKMTIIEIQENETIKYNLEFFEPQPMASKISWELEPTATGTRAIWTNYGTLSYPVERFMGLMLDGMLGPDFERGLNNLKNLLEQK